MTNKNSEIFDIRSDSSRTQNFENRIQDPGPLQNCLDHQHCLKVAVFSNIV